MNSDLAIAFRLNSDLVTSQFRCTRCTAVPRGFRHFVTKRVSSASVSLYLIFFAAGTYSAGSHHMLEYNPVHRTWLTLQPSHGHVRTPSGALKPTLLDDIWEFDMNGAHCRPVRHPLAYHRPFCRLLSFRDW